MNSWPPTGVTSSVAEYLSHLPAADSLSLPLHHFLKFSSDTIKRESTIESSPLSLDGTEGHMLEMTADDADNDLVSTYYRIYPARLAFVCPPSSSSTYPPTPLPTHLPAYLPTYLTSSILIDGRLFELVKG